MKKISGKKLLILGANPETCAIVNKANNMGVYTIVTDYNPNAPAKKLASKCYDVDCLDIPSLLELAKNENIDGIMVGVADILVPIYQRLCDLLKVPCYGTEKQVKVFSNKFNFKRTCEKYGIHGIPEYTFKDYDHIPNDIEYPVLVKPVDNCSGKGISVCYNIRELQEGIQKALSLSRNKQILIERYMTCDDMMFYYTFKDGYCSVSMIGDRYTCHTQEDVSPVCLADRFPSKNTKLYFDTVHPKIIKMFDELGMKNGILLIQAFVEDNQIFVYDPGFRLQGAAPHLLINAVNGFDQIELLIEFALTGSMGSVDLKKVDDYMLRGKTAGSLWFLLKEGTIGNIEGLNGLCDDERIINILQRFKVGDTITPEMIGTEQQVIFRIHLVCSSLQEYKDTIMELQKKIVVTDSLGNDMLIHEFDVSLL